MILRGFVWFSDDNERVETLTKPNIIDQIDDRGLLRICLSVYLWIWLFFSICMLV